jgi:hypothetical protein
MLLRSVRMGEKCLRRCEDGKNVTEKCEMLLRSVRMGENVLRRCEDG